MGLQILGIIEKSTEQSGRKVAEKLGINSSSYFKLKHETTSPKLSTLMIIWRYLRVLGWTERQFLKQLEKEDGL